jgi:hypothetical protein
LPAVAALCGMVAELCTPPSWSAGAAIVTALTEVPRVVRQRPYIYQFLACLCCTTGAPCCHAQQESAVLMGRGHAVPWRRRVGAVLESSSLGNRRPECSGSCRVQWAEGPSSWSRSGVCCWRGPPVLSGRPLKVPAIESACVCAGARRWSTTCQSLQLRCAGNNCCRKHDVCMGSGGVTFWVVLWAPSPLTCC